MTSLIWSKAAELELTDIVAWYEAVDPALARRFVEHLETTLTSITRHPLSRPKLEEATSADELRKARIRQFPYFLVYFVEREAIRILAVAHLRREPLYWVDRLH